MLPNPPQELCCPISEDILVDPVVLVETGQTYDRQSVERWFREGHNSCPLTSKVLTTKQLVPNFIVKGLVDAWRQAHLPSDIAPAGNGSTEPSNNKYPQIFDGSPQDRAAQLSAALSHIRSPSMKVGSVNLFHPAWHHSGNVPCLLLSLK